MRVDICIDTRHLEVLMKEGRAHSWAVVIEMPKAG